MSPTGQTRSFLLISGRAMVAVCKHPEHYLLKTLDQKFCNTLRMLFPVGSKSHGEPDVHESSKLETVMYLTSWTANDYPFAGQEFVDSFCFLLCIVKTLLSFASRSIQCDWPIKTMIHSLSEEF